MQEDVVPLSREERRALEEIERGLCAADPDLGDRLRGARRASRRTVSWTVGLISGVALLVCGMTGTSSVHVGLAVGGFAMVVTSCCAALSGRRRGRRRYRAHGS
jgi:hypothetical protein